MSAYIRVSLSQEKDSVLFSIAGGVLSRRAFELYRAVASAHARFSTGESGYVIRTRGARALGLNLKTEGLPVKVAPGASEVMGVYPAVANIKARCARGDCDEVGGENGLCAYHEEKEEEWRYGEEEPHSGMFEI